MALVWYLTIKGFRHLREARKAKDLDTLKEKTLLKPERVVVRDQTPKNHRNDDTGRT